MYNIVWYQWDDEYRSFVKFNCSISGDKLLNKLEYFLKGDKKRKEYGTGHHFYVPKEYCLEPKEKL